MNGAGLMGMFAISAGFDSADFSDAGDELGFTVH
jgi:hypothetical protein